MECPRLELRDAHYHSARGAEPQIRAVDVGQRAAERNATGFDQCFSEAERGKLGPDYLLEARCRLRKYVEGAARGATNRRCARSIS